MLEQFTGSRSESFGSDPGVRSARPAAAPSDLDLARPQTAGEEELQLQLALAMSREEAEKEEERRRSDDVRLALAMAQSQEDNGYSKFYFKPSHCFSAYFASPRCRCMNHPCVSLNLLSGSYQLFDTNLCLMS